MPQLRACLAIGGVPVSESLEVIGRLESLKSEGYLGDDCGVVILFFGFNTRSMLGYGEARFISFHLQM
jgi:hypothetical protein